jgi:hypothetical protein
MRKGTFPYQKIRRGKPCGNIQKCHIVKLGIIFQKLFQASMRMMTIHVSLVVLEFRP